jgi:hypothetical protein
MRRSLQPENRRPRRIQRESLSQIKVFAEQLHHHCASVVRGPEQARPE